MPREKSKGVPEEEASSSKLRRRQAPGLSGSKSWVWLSRGSVFGVFFDRFLISMVLDVIGCHPNLAQADDVYLGDESKKPPLKATLL